MEAFKIGTGTDLLISLEPRKAYNICKTVLNLNEQLDIRIV